MWFLEAEDNVNVLVERIEEEEQSLIWYFFATFVVWEAGLKECE